MEMKGFWKEMSLACIPMAIMQREEKFLCNQATSCPSQSLIHVLAVRQLLWQSILLSLQPAAVSKALLAKSFPALSSTVFTCCTDSAPRQEEYSCPLQKDFKAFCKDRKKQSEGNKIVTLVPLNSSFLRHEPWKQLARWRDGQVTEIFRGNETENCSNDRMNRNKLRKTECTCRRECHWLARQCSRWTGQ